MNSVSKQTVLVVDDIAENIAVLNSVLAPQYRILAATNGEKALSLARSKPAPDIILLDVMMPGMDGHEVCRQLKSDLITRHIPVIFITALTEIGDETRGFELGAVDYITKPISPPIVQARVRTQLALYDQNRELQRLVAEKTSQLKDTQLAIIERLGRAAEFKDNETGKHVIRMSDYSRILGLALGMSEEDADILKLAAPMHDIGKIGIPDHILQAPRRLDDAELSEMRSHATYGGEILGDHDSELLQMAKAIALTHHEKWDGTGYPAGLKGEAIPLAARIVAVADVFDALTSVRPYKKAWPIDDALDYIESEAGKHFDPSIVMLVRENLPAIMEVYNIYHE